MVRIGRVAIVLAMIIAIAFTWNDLLGISGSGGYTFIQKYTGYISPGVFSCFILGMFWKRTTGAAALAGIIIGFVSSIFFGQFAVKVLGTETILYTAFPNGTGIYEIPFFVCMGWSFCITVIVMVLMSLAGPKINAKAFSLYPEMFRVRPTSIALIACILLILSALYIRFW
jgi:SSS family solute:Na+ symporter